jgi:hypothetical protein
LAIRVCQPGPVAFHRATTSGAKRRLIICFGFGDLGLPAFLKTARASISSVSSGSSSYSSGLMTCASTRLRSEPKVGRKVVLLTVVGLPHAEHMANSATLRVPNHHQPALKKPKADDSGLSIVLPLVLDLRGQAREHPLGVFEVQSTVGERPVTLWGIVGDLHAIIVCTQMDRGKGQTKVVWM